MMELKRMNLKKLCCIVECAASMMILVGCAAHEVKTTTLDLQWNNVGASQTTKNIKVAVIKPEYLSTNISVHPHSNVSMILAMSTGEPVDEQVLRR